MNNSKKRIEWIDTARGLGILLVVLGHVDPPINWTIFIYTFHMPLFFFLSGYLFSINKHNTLGIFLRNKSRTLLIPYFSFSILSLAFSIGLSIFSSGDFNILKSLLGIFYSNGINGWMNYNIALWFLTCLFVVETMFYFIAKKVKNLKLLFFFVVMFSVLGYMDSLYMPIRLPWSIDISFSAIVFFGLGFLSKKYEFDKILFENKAFFFIIPLLVTSWFVKDMINNNYIIDMNYNKLNHYYNFYIPAICGILFFIIFSSIIKSNFLVYLGKNSLIILASHLPIITLARWVINACGITVYNQTLRSVILTLFTVLIVLPTIFIVNHYFPLIVGRRKQSIPEPKILYGLK
jgi:fucose 4-O-acetylase-like acetyltransferase